jgi:hypothetical protein
MINSTQRITRVQIGVKLAKQLPSPAEQLERLTNGLDRLAVFDPSALTPNNSKSRRMVLLVDIEIERLEKECQIQ